MDHTTHQVFHDDGLSVADIPATGKVHTSIVNRNWRFMGRPRDTGQETTVGEMLVNRAVRLYISLVCRNGAGGTVTRSLISEGSSVA